MEFLHDVLHALKKWIYINDGIICFFYCSYYLQKSHRKYIVHIRNPSLCLQMNAMQNDMTFFYEFK
uniref:Ovule protein n=1 Tax=Ascaris lumbricoides TaxID=6252 RepID=A0A0M3IK40_ASCLU